MYAKECKSKKHSYLSSEFWKSHICLCVIREFYVNLQPNEKKENKIIYEEDYKAHGERISEDGKRSN